MIREEIRGPKGDLCHIVLRRPEYSADERYDIATAAEFLQLGVILAGKSKAFRSHIHLEREVTLENFRAQESWVVIQGSVLVKFFDEDGQPIQTSVLEPGDLSITFRGGHGYEMLEDTVVYEFKSGPYLGQEADKRFLD